MSVSMAQGHCQMTKMLRNHAQFVEDDITMNINNARSKESFKLHIYQMMHKFALQIQISLFNPSNHCPRVCMVHFFKYTCCCYLATLTLHGTLSQRLPKEMLLKELSAPFLSYQEVSWMGANTVCFQSEQAALPHQTLSAKR